MTIEKELNRIVESISLIQTSQAEVPFSEEALEDFTDSINGLRGDISDVVDRLR